MKVNSFHVRVKFQDYLFSKCLEKNQIQRIPFFSEMKPRDRYSDEKYLINHNHWARKIAISR